MVADASNLPSKDTQHLTVYRVLASQESQGSFGGWNRMIVAILQKIKSTDESERGELKSWLKIQHSKNKDHGI